MNCDEYEMLISAYADGELDGSDLKRLKAHISQCDSCRRIYEDTLRLQEDLTQALLASPIIPDLVSAVESRIRPKNQVRFAWAWAVAAVFVGLALVTAALRPAHVHTVKKPVAIVEHKPEPVQIKSLPKPKKYPVILARKPHSDEHRPAAVKRDKTATVHIAKFDATAVEPAEESAEVTIKYTDARSEPTNVALFAPPPCVRNPLIWPNERLALETEPVMENGRLIWRMCYWIIEKPEDTASLGAQNEKN